MQQCTFVCVASKEKMVPSNVPKALAATVPNLSSSYLMHAEGIDEVSIAAWTTTHWIATSAALAWLQGREVFCQMQWCP